MTMRRKHAQKTVCQLLQVDSFDVCTYCDRLCKLCQVAWLFFVTEGSCAMSRAPFNSGAWCMITPLTETLTNCHYYK